VRTHAGRRRKRSKSHPQLGGHRETRSAAPCAARCWQQRDFEIRRNCADSWTGLDRSLHVSPVTTGLISPAGMRRPSAPLLVEAFRAATRFSSATLRVAMRFSSSWPLQLRGALLRLLFSAQRLASAPRPVIAQPASAPPGVYARLLVSLPPAASMSATGTASRSRRTVPSAARISGPALSTIWLLC
jgi:hypothetical protein